MLSVPELHLSTLTIR